MATTNTEFSVANLDFSTIKSNLITFMQGQDIFSDYDFTGSNLNVSYQGEVGQIFFNENAEIIMRGKILNDGIFYTKDLSVKCPSKYLDEMYTEDYSKENSSS